MKKSFFCDELFECDGKAICNFCVYGRFRVVGDGDDFAFGKIFCDKRRDGGNSVFIQKNIVFVFSVKFFEQSFLNFFIGFEKSTVAIPCAGCHRKIRSRQIPMRRRQDDKSFDFRIVPGKFEKPFVDEFVRQKMVAHNSCERHVVFCKILLDWNFRSIGRNQIAFLPSRKMRGFFFFQNFLRF